MAKVRKKLTQYQVDFEPINESLEALQVNQEDFVEIRFDRIGGYVYGTKDAPVTNVAMGINLELAKKFVSVKMYHQSDSVPTFDLGDVVSANIVGTYVTSEINEIVIIHSGDTNVTIGYINSNGGTAIQDGVEVVGDIDITTPTTADLSGFTYRISGVKFTSGTLTGIPITGTPSLYPRTDFFIGKFNPSFPSGGVGIVEYLPGTESEDQVILPVIPPNAVLLGSAIRNIDGSNVFEPIDPDLSDFVSKSALGNQTIQSEFTIAKKAGLLPNFATFDTNGGFYRSRTDQAGIHSTLQGIGGYSRILRITLNLPAQINYFATIEFYGISDNYESGELWVHFQVDSGGDIIKNSLKGFGQFDVTKYILVKVGATHYDLFAIHDESTSFYKFRPSVNFGGASIYEYFHLNDKFGSLPAGDQYTFSSFNNGIKKQVFEYVDTNVFELDFNPLDIIAVKLQGNDLYPDGISYTISGNIITIGYDLQTDDSILVIYTTGTIGGAAVSTAEAESIFDNRLALQKDQEGGIAANDTAILNLDTVDDFTSLDRKGRTRFYVNDLNRGGMFSYVASGVVPDGGTVFAVADGFAVRNFSGDINPVWFGAVGDGVTDSTAAIQAAIDTGRNISIPEGVFIISSPIYIDGNITILGRGRSRTKIRKLTSTVGVGSNTARTGTIIDSYAVNAVLILRHADNTYNYRTRIFDIGIAGDGNTITGSEYAIYAPRTSELTLGRVWFENCKNGLYTFDSWLCNMDQVVANPNDPVTGWSGSFGFRWADDGSGLGTGTTLTATSCWARDCANGWALFGLSYSTLNCPAADNITTRSYYFHLCTGLTVNGGGTESSSIANGAAVGVNGGNVVFNGFRATNIIGSIGGTTAMLKLEDCSVIFNSCLFENFATANSSFNLIVQDGARIMRNTTTFPTNGNNFIGYGSNSYIISSGQDPLVTDSSGTRYLRGRLRDNSVREKSMISVAALGTVVATFTASASASLEMGVCRLYIAWYDVSTPHASGIAEMIVGVHRVSAGPTYRESITEIVNAVAGEVGAAIPVFSISRIGNIWSLTMTPASGACTIRTIRIEPENYLGISSTLS